MALSLAMSKVDQGLILVLIAIVVLPIAAIAFARSGEAWKSIGRGRFGIEPERPPRSGAQSSVDVEQAELVADIRQMLEAESYRRVQRGETPLDVEAEVNRRLADL
jgi:hypothetical protein